VGIGLVSDPSETASADLVRGRNMGDREGARDRNNWAGSKSTDTELVGTSREAVALTVRRTKSEGILFPVDKRVMRC
jgi:hypothetical protein